MCVKMRTEKKGVMEKSFCSEIEVFRQEKAHNICYISEFIQTIKTGKRQTKYGNPLDD